jgi:hypothetical protein
VQQQHRLEVFNQLLLLLLLPLQQRQHNLTQLLPLPVAF